ncbi:MAG: cupin domain-containing protein [Vulcanimicrobiota bacterium]
MRPIHADNVTWKARARGIREAQIYSAFHGSDETRIDMVEVPAGGYIPPHRHSARTEFITILSSAGAQLQIGDRIFRPMAGQVFQREPGDLFALTNDSQHSFCYSVVRFGYESSDVEFLHQPEAEDEAIPERVDALKEEPVTEAVPQDKPSEEAAAAEEVTSEEAVAEEPASEVAEPAAKPEPEKKKKGSRKKKPKGEKKKK